MKRRLFAIASLLIALAMPYQLLAEGANPLPQAEVESIQRAVRLQLHAFSQDDAVRAFELATPSIRSQMGSPENFLRIIKEEFSPIYRNLMVIFSRPEVMGDSTIQIVRLTDSHSRVWLAIYSMERDTAGAWKIDGCQLIETSSVSV